MLVLSAAVAIALGVMIAAQLGPAMVDPMFFIPFACLSAFLAGQSAASTPPATTGRAVLGSTAFMALTLAISLAIVNLDPPRNRFPDWRTAIAAAVLSIATAFFTAAAVPWLVRFTSASAAKWILRGVMAAVYCLYRWMPGEWLAWINEQASQNGVLAPAVVFAAIAIAAGFALQDRFHRRGALPAVR